MGSLLVFHKENKLQENTLVYIFCRIYFVHVKADGKLRTQVGFNLGFEKGLLLMSAVHTLLAKESESSSFIHRLALLTVTLLKLLV